MKLSNEVWFVIASLSALSCAGSDADDSADTSVSATSTTTGAGSDSSAAGTENSPTGSAGSPSTSTGSGTSGSSTATTSGASGTSSSTAPEGTDPDPNGTTTGSTTQEPATTSTPSSTEPSADPEPSASGDPEGEGGAPSTDPTGADPTGTDPTGTETSEPEPEPPVTEEPDDSDVVDVGADEKFSFFVTSYYHIKLLSGSDDGFGGDLRWNGATTGLEGADALCQEMARRVSFGHRTWRAYLSTSTVNAIDRVGDGPWYDFTGALVAEDVAGLLVPKAEEGGGGGGFGGGGPGGGGMGGSCVEDERPAGGALDCGTYDETGLLHNGQTDQDGDGVDDDDHDTMTATLADGTYSGFSCDDWTSTSATPEGGLGMRDGGILMGHSWPAGSGTHWSESHAGHACAAGTNFIQDGGGDSSTVGGGGGYGGFYCLAVD